MKLGRIEHRKPRSRRGEAIILFAVGPYRFGISAQAVEEIRNTDGVRSFAHGFTRAQKVRQTLERDRKTYFVVDATTHLRMLSSRSARLLLLRERPIALSVDSIDRMSEITSLHPLPRAFQGEERRWYRGLAMFGEDIVPVLDPEVLLSKTELAAMQAALPKDAALAKAVG
jgi:chemotaxis signal transduction protein